jgi:hypothetical protein
MQTNRRNFFKVAATASALGTSSAKADSPKQMVLISTIKLTKEFRSSFESGAGQTPRYFDYVDYDALKNIVNLYDGPDRLIITTGGLIAFNAARDNIKQANYISLSGPLPTGDLSRCLGGVLVSGFGANINRVSLLVGKGYARGNIGLFCNQKSAMNTSEEYDWLNNIPGVNPQIIHAGNSNGHNDSSQYQSNFAQASALGITALVISSDPFFFYTRNDLIKWANDWITTAPSGAPRYICFPFPEYTNSDGSYQPIHKSSSWYGSSLLDAYKQIGVAAALQLSSTSTVGFASVPEASGDF